MTGGYSLPHWMGNQVRLPARTLFPAGNTTVAEAANARTPIVRSGPLITCDTVSWKGYLAEGGIRKSRQSRDRKEADPGIVKGS
jgi:hypothetical protein